MMASVLLIQIARIVRRTLSLYLGASLTAIFVARFVMEVCGMARNAALPWKIVKSLMPALIAGALLPAPAGCSSSLKSADAGTDACPLIAGLTFYSVDEMECGLAPPDAGVATCHWSVAFTTTGSFSWRHSDVVESGTYTCNGATITGTRGGTFAPITGTLEFQTYGLTWDGVRYASPLD
jgi:hypothetical protein